MSAGNCGGEFVMQANDELIIRNEQTSDHESITKVVQLAFEKSPYSDQQEHLIVQALRSSGALSVSIIAQANGEIVGFAGASQVQISDGSEHWYALGPIAVIPGSQKQGIGSMLLDEVLYRLKMMGASGCVVLGDPDFYSRFGFEPDQRLAFADFDPELFQSLRFNDNLAQGEVSYHPAFYSQN